MTAKEQKATKVKLSKVQQEIVELLRNGWELGVSIGMDGRCWIQKGGIGRGGESKNISSSTVAALKKLNLLHAVEKTWIVEKYAVDVSKV